MKASAPTLSAIAALLLAACSADEPLTLPADPLDRSATCGVVAAAAARVGTAVEAPLSLEAQGKILHFTLLGASEGGAFDSATARGVGERMRALEGKITSGAWQPLVPQCDAAYPVAGKKTVELPAGRLDAQLACEELAQFVVVALEGQGTGYANELARYRLMRRQLNDALAPGLRARAGSNRERQQRERHRALAAAAKLGTPTAVMDRCLARFG